MLNFKSSSIIFISLFILFLFPIYFFLNYIYKTSDRAEYLLEFIYKIENLPKNDILNQYISWLDVNDLYFFENEFYQIHDKSYDNQGLAEYNDSIKNLEIIIDEPKRILRIIFEIKKLEDISIIRKIVTETIIKRTHDIISKRNDLEFILDSLVKKNYACESMLKDLKDIKESFSIADKILIFKAGVLQQYDEPFKIYCNPSNCYCAKALGDLNMINIASKIYYLRPENISIVNNSNYKGIVNKCSFVGKEFQINASFFEENWILFSKNSFKAGCEIYISFNDNDLIQFDSNCDNYFTQPTREQ